MINRDSLHTSLWQQTTEPFITRPLSMPDATVYDTVIVGGGITGVSTALLLQQAGQRCLLIEAANLGFGTTGGTTAHLNTLLDTPYTTIQKNFTKETAGKVAVAAAAAIDLIRQHIEKYRIDCAFTEANAYLFAQGREQEKELEHIYTASGEAGLDVSYVDELPVPIPFSKVMRAAKQARFHPLHYLYGLATAFQEAGGVILQQCRVTDVKNEEPLSITTTMGTFAGRDLVYATHIPPGVNLLHLRCTPYRSYAMAVLLEDDKYPQGLCYDMVDPYHYYRSQEAGGRTYLIAGGKDHKTGQEENTTGCFRELEATVRNYFAVKEVAFRWSSQYFEPADGLPYIGHLPQHPEHIYVATGFGGNGMIYSSVAAMVLRSLLTKETSPMVDPAIFNPNRLKPIAGFTNFITHNVDAVKNFAGRLFPANHLASLSGLAPGEGKLVQYDNQKIGLFKDEKGALHAINPVCTHLKCEVKWNSAEHSWDCPCHGARYDIDGNVLTGPADMPLEKVDLDNNA